jgi:hypothetical protein
VIFRTDAAFPKPKIYDALKERDVKYAILLPANDNLERKIVESLTTRSEGPAASRLRLSVIAYNVGNLWRRLALPRAIGNWSPIGLQQLEGRLIKRALLLVTAGGESSSAPAC